MNRKVKKIWHGGCKKKSATARPTEDGADKNKKRSKKMNGLIKQTKLDGVNVLGSLAIALSGVFAVLYMMANGVGGIA